MKHRCPSLRSPQNPLPLLPLQSVESAALALSLAAASACRMPTGRRFANALPQLGLARARIYANARCASVLLCLLAGCAATTGEGDAAELGTVGAPQAFEGQGAAGAGALPMQGAAPTQVVPTGVGMGIAGSGAMPVEPMAPAQGPQQQMPPAAPVCEYAGSHYACGDLGASALALQFSANVAISGGGTATVWFTCDSPSPTCAMGAQCYVAPRIGGSGYGVCVGGGTGTAGSAGTVARPPVATGTGGSAASGTGGAAGGDAGSGGAAGGAAGSGGAGSLATGGWRCRINAGQSLAGQPFGCGAIASAFSGSSIQWEIGQTTYNCSVAGAPACKIAQQCTVFVPNQAAPQIGTCEAAP